MVTIRAGVAAPLQLSWKNLIIIGGHHRIYQKCRNPEDENPKPKKCYRHRQK